MSITLLLRPSIQTVLRLTITTRGVITNIPMKMAITIATKTITTTITAIAITTRTITLAITMTITLKGKPYQR